MRTIMLLTAKDLKQRLRDKSFLIIGILAPLVLSVILTSVAGDVFEGSFQPSYRVHDATGVIGEGLVASLVEDAGFDDVTLVDTREEAIAAVEDNEASAAILIPEELTSTSGAANIEIIGNVGDSLSTAVAASIAQGLASEVAASRLAAGGLAVAGVVDPAAYAGAVGLPNVIAIDDVPAGNRVLNGRTFLAVGMAIFFLFFTVQAAVINVLEERQNGTLRRLLVAPVGRGTILIGKTLAAAVTGLIAMAVLVVATTLLLGADWGDAWGIALLSLAGVVAAMGIGSLLATVTRTAEQAGQFGGIVVTVLGLLGGVFFPITGAGWLVAVTRISPHKWLMEGFGANAGTGGVADVVVPALVVLGFGLLLGAIALTRRSRLTGVV